MSKINTAIKAVKANRKAIIKKTLIIGSAVAGVALAGGFAIKGLSEMDAAADVVDVALDTVKK